MMILSTKSHYVIYKLGTSNQPNIYRPYRPENPKSPSGISWGSAWGLASKIEKKYSDSPLITHRERKFPRAIITAGIPYTFKVDGYIEKLGIWLEFKMATSNGKKDIATAYNKLLAQAYYRGVIPLSQYNDYKVLQPSQQVHDLLSGLLFPRYKKDCLDHAFNHSKHKLALVSHYFQGQLLVVYANAVKLTEKELATLRRLGITAINERQFDQVLKQLEEPNPDIETIRKELQLPTVRTLH